MSGSVASSVTAGAGASDSPAATGYRPQLDGLRAVAVTLVVLFHSGVPSFSEGFVGVDVFFVLSGYLVTRLLLRRGEAGRWAGLPRFYARRFRRLLPASVVVLVVTTIVFTALASPLEVRRAAGGIRAAFCYVANWFFIGESSDYFAADVRTSPVLHFWSLAIEEQFYLVWPVLLFAIIGTVRRLGRGRTTVVVAVGALALASLAWSAWLAGSSPSRAYYGTDTRAYQLLAGALLALSPGVLRAARRRSGAMPAVAVIGLAGVVALATPWLGVGLWGRGVLAAALSVVLLVAVEATDRGPTAVVLRSAPVVYLGRISYGLYLWHWPVILVIRRLADPGPWSTAALTMLIASGLASLSLQILERPVRESSRLDRIPRPVIAIGVAVSLLGGLVVVPAITRDRGAPPPVAAGAGGGATVVPADLDLVAADAPLANSGCTDRPVTACTRVASGTPSVLLLGDSHAMPLIPAFESAAATEGFAFSAAVAQACPWAEGLDWWTDEPRVQRNVERCPAARADWYDRVVRELDPDVVVLVHRPFDDPVSSVAMKGRDGARVAPGDPRYVRLVRAATERTLERLRRSGRRVAIIEPIPAAPTDPLTCLDGAAVLDECRYVASPGPTPVERIYRDLADAGTVAVIDLDRVVCPYLPICDPVVGGRVVKRDAGHLTRDFGASLAGVIAAGLRERGLIGA